MTELLFGRKRLPSWPDGPFETVIVSNRDERPAYAPEVPGPVNSLVKAIQAGGWITEVGYSRAFRRGQRTGTYRVADFYGVYAGAHNTSPYRIVAIYWRFADKTEEFSYFSDVGALEQTEKACGTPGAWTWQDGRIVLGFNRYRVKVTDIKEFVKVRGSVLQGWFAGISRRFAEQAAKQLCGDLVEHDPHTWDTVNGIAKSCSGKASKPKEVEAP